MHGGAFRRVAGGFLQGSAKNRDDNFVRFGHPLLSHFNVKYQPIGLHTKSYNALFQIEHTMPVLSHLHEGPTFGLLKRGGAMPFEEAHDGVTNPSKGGFEAFRMLW